MQVMDTGTSRKSINTDALKALKASQRAWASRTGRTVDGNGYCTCIDDNMFRGLSAAARKEFECGDGTELGTADERGKIQALHSSSALACNWFDYWRRRDFEPLSRAFGRQAAFCELVGLEQKFSTGLAGIGPNLDVVLKCLDGSLFAIESKFTEPYAVSRAKTFLKPKYFRDGRNLWAERHLGGCQAVADSLRTGQHPFKVLDVAQLLKHMLALAGSGQHWSLCCLWFELPGPLAERHRKELDEFAARIGIDAEHFSGLTYQELFLRMSPLIAQNHPDYFAYLKDRYLSEGVPEALESEGLPRRRSMLAS